MEDDQYLALKVMKMRNKCGYDHALTRKCCENTKFGTQTRPNPVQIPPRWLAA